MAETHPEVWKRLSYKPGGMEVKQRFAAEYKSLLELGVPKEEALERLAGDGGPFSKVKYPGPVTGPTAAVVAAAPSPVVHSALKESEDRKVEMERQEKAKRRLAKGAGSNKDQREWAEWASRWLSLVRREDGVHRWDEVVGEGSVAPHQGAVALLEQWCKNPEKFSEQLGKLLGKQSDLSDDLVRRERKRESELVRLLQEVDAEIEARGDEAYA